MVLTSVEKEVIKRKERGYKKSLTEEVVGLLLLEGRKKGSETWGKGGGGLPGWESW